MKKLAPILLLLICISWSGMAHAAETTQTASQFCTGGSCTYVPLEPLPGLPGCYGPNPPTSCKNASTGSFASLIPAAFKLLIGAGGLIAIVMIVLGALTYMFSDVVGNKTKALSRIRNAMWAIVLLLSSYLILYTLNPDLVSLKLTISTSNNFTTYNATQSTTNSTNSTNSTSAFSASSDTSATQTKTEAQAADANCTQQGKMAVKITSNNTYECI